MRTSTSFTAALAVGLTVALSGAPVAQAVPPRAGGSTGGGGAATSDGVAWRPLFDEGRRAHEAGRFEDAAEAFYRAREAGGPPLISDN